MANKPLILSHNYFDDAVLFPTHVVSHSGTAVDGSEVFHIADNLRDITRFTIAETNAAMNLTVDCITAKSADALVLDRGHNLGGKTVEIRASTDNFGASDVLIASCVIPASASGLPSDANGCYTEEAAWCKTFGSASYRYWRVRVLAMGAGLAPSLTGVYLGKTYRFPEYLQGPAAYDFRTNHRSLKNEMSWGGVRVRRRLLNFAEVDLKLKLEDADFAAFHAEAKYLLQYGQPWWFCLDDSVAADAGRTRLFQLPGDTVYDPVVNPVHREIAFLLEEVAPLLAV